MSRSRRTFFSALALGLILLVACGEMPTTSPTAGPSGSPSPASTPAACEAPQQEQPSGTQIVHVYFHCTTADPFNVDELTRYVPEGTDPLTSAVSELLEGPTREEDSAGYWSFFSTATAGYLNSVSVEEEGTATVDFRDFSGQLGSFATAQAAQFFNEINSTVFQFEQIQKVIYQFDGSCDAFHAWLEAICNPIPRSRWEAMDSEF